MDTFLFPQGPRGRQAQVSRSNVLLDATIRDFSGGWNESDNDLNLDTKFAKKLENMQRGLDGSQQVRPGTKLFADASAYLDDIINIEYYNGYLIAVGQNGKVVSIDSVGTIILIWSDDIAASLSGSPTGWTTTTFVSFAIFNGELIICNGVNKPLIVHNTMQCEFLKDLADNSNANTPICRFVVTHNRYLVMAGDPTDGAEDRLFISNTDTSGTWVGDSAPNDAVNVDLGSRVPSGDATIKGIGRFRDNILIMFENAILPGTIGAFSGDDHIPSFSDSIDNVGSLSHRVIQTVGENMIFADASGVTVSKRALFTGSVTGEKASQLIDPAYRKHVGNLKSILTTEDRAWALWDGDADNYMLFIPNSDIVANTTENRCFTYKRNEKLKIEAWADWRNWNFRCGCVSALKRTFLCEGAEVFLLGETSDGDNIYKDYEGREEMWDDETPWSDYTGWNPVADTTDSGVPIKFVWELPWSDNRQRFLVKGSRYLNFDTTGDNRFKAEMFTDNIYLDRSDLGEDWQEDTLKWDDDLGWELEVLNPILSMDFEGGDAPGFGADEFGKDFGGGRPTRLESLYAWTTKYKLQKLRMSGDGIKELKFVSITLAYQTGSPRR